MADVKPLWLSSLISSALAQKSCEKKRKFKIQSHIFLLNWRPKREGPPTSIKMGKIVRQVAAYFSVTSLVSYVLSSPPSVASQPSSTPKISPSSLRFWNGTYSQAAAYQVQTNMLSSVRFPLSLDDKQ